VAEPHFRYVTSETWLASLWRENLWIRQAISVVALSGAAAPVTKCRAKTFGDGRGIPVCFGSRLPLSPRLGAKAGGP